MNVGGGCGSRADVWYELYKLFQNWCDFGNLFQYWYDTMISPFFYLDVGSFFYLVCLVL
jgi:hypothetical protein